MRVGNVSLMIPEGRERDSGHVEMVHGKQYVLKLGNHYNNRRIDAEVMIDGKDMGTYRVDSGRNVVLECSSSDRGRFTFFSATSGEAVQAGVANIGKDDKGLVQVTFKAEKPSTVKTVGPVHVGTPLDRERLNLKTTGGIRGQSAGRDDNIRLCSAPATEQEEKTCGGILMPEDAGLGFASRRLSVNESSGLKAGVTGLTGHSNTHFIEVPNLDYDHNETTVISLRLVTAAPVVREMLAAPKSNPVPAAVG